MPIKAILTDIEGTTSAVSFVFDVLFPYAAQHLPAFIREHAEDPQVAMQLGAVRLDSGEPEADVERVIEILQQWIAEDRKATPLKALQGMIWKQGYEAGELKGHVYPDAVEALKAWHEQGYALYVYSSGSAYAQKLLFGYSDAGDLTPLFSGYFDTQIGHKRDAAAYQRIVEAIGVPASTILFLSDIREELDAAQQAGLKTCCLVRENQSVEGLVHPWVVDFDAIAIDAL